MGATKVCSTPLFHFMEDIMIRKVVTFTGLVLLFFVLILILSTASMRCNDTVSTDAEVVTPKEPPEPKVRKPESGQ